MKRLLEKIVQPFTNTNGKLYKWTNQQSANVLKHWKGNVGITSNLSFKVTANGITSFRSTLLLPTLVLFSQGYSIIPASLVVTNVTLDYVDGAVARWEQKQRLNKLRIETNNEDAKKLLSSSNSIRIKDTWGAYYDAIADKAFAIPVWMCCFQQYGDESILQAALLAHVGIETYSSYVRTKAYFKETSPYHWINDSSTGIKNIPIPKNSEQEEKTKEVENKKAKSAVVAGIVGKTKQFMAMLGTSLVMIPMTHTFGTILLCGSVPLAIASVLQKSKNTTVYAELLCDSGNTLNARSLEYIEKSKTYGSNLIIGLRQQKVEEKDSNKVIYQKQEYSDIVKAIRLHPSVDSVICHQNLPESQTDIRFIEEYNIDIIALPLYQQDFENYGISDETFGDLQSGKIRCVTVDI